MRKFQKKFSLILALFAGIALSLTCAQAGEKAAGKTIYTKVNIWYEKPDKIPTSNYHEGVIIPVGTKVTITGTTAEQVKFTTDKNASFTLVFVVKHSKPGTSINDIINQYFSEQNPLESEQYKKFTADEKENIRKGEIKNGMSKEAVLMAYGYPSGNKTPGLAYDIWFYPKSRFNNISVKFENNKVVKIEG